MSGDAQMQFLGEHDGVRWYWAEPGQFQTPGVYYWNGRENVHVRKKEAEFITPLMEQQMFDDWCPYKGNPDPRTVWSAAINSVNGLLLGANVDTHQSEFASEEVQRFAIDVEKLLCEKLGRSWSPSGMSIQTLVDELAAQAQAKEILYREMEEERNYFKNLNSTIQRHNQNDSWYWQGDGTDHIESMTYGLPVVIRAEQFRELIGSRDKEFDLICQAIDKADSITMEGDYMLDSNDCINVVRVMQALLDISPSKLR